MQLSKKREQEITKFLQQSLFNGQVQYFYAIASKQSGSKFFSNNRLIWINIRENCINYSDIGKVQPFDKGNTPLIKGSIKIVNENFRYERMQVKQATMRVWQQNDGIDNKGILKDWCFSFQNMKLLDDIINIIKNLKEKDDLSKNIKNVQETSKVNLMESQGKESKVHQSVLKNFGGQSSLQRNLDTSLQSGKETKNIEYFDQYEQRIISVSPQPLNKSSKPKKQVVIPPLKLPNSSNSPQKSSFKYPFAQANNSSQQKIPQAKQRFPQNLYSMGNQNSQTRQVSPKLKDLSSHKISSSVSLNNNYRGSMRKMSDQQSSFNSSVCLNVDMKGNEYRDSDFEQKDQGKQKIMMRKMSNKQKFYHSNSLYNKQGDSPVKKSQDKSIEKKVYEKTVSKSFLQNDESYLKSKNVESSHVSEGKNNHLNFESQKGPQQHYHTDRYDKMEIESKADNRTDKHKIKYQNENRQENIGSRTFKYSQSNKSEYENKNISKSGTSVNDKQVPVMNTINSKKIQQQKNQNSGSEDWNSEQQGDVMTTFEKESQNEIKMVRNRRNSRSEIDVHDWKDRSRDRDREMNVIVDRQTKKQQNTLTYQKIPSVIQSQSRRQKQYPNRSMYKSKTYQQMQHPSKTNYIDWNRLFYNSNYNMKIYDDFVVCCKQIIMTGIFCEDVSMLSTKGINFNVFRHFHLDKQELQSSYRCQIPDKYKQRFKQYEQKQQKCYDSLINQKQNLKKNVSIKQKSVSVHNFSQDMNNLIFMYSKSKNQVQRLRKLWESNQKIMQTILVSKLRGKICAGLSCLIEYAACTVYCEAAIQYSNDYEPVESNNENFKEIVKQLSYLINISIQKNSYKAFSSNFDVNGSSCFIMNFINPLFGVGKPNSLLNMYTNSLNPMQSACSSLHVEFLQQLNKGMCRRETSFVSGQLFSICGSQNYYNLLNYYCVSYYDIQQFYKNVKSEYYKQMMVTQLCGDVFVIYLCSALNQQVREFDQYLKDIDMGDGKVNRKINVVQQYVRTKGIKVCLFKTTNYTSFGYKQQESLNNLTGCLSIYMQFYKQIVYVWLDCLLSYNGEISELLWDQIIWTVWTIYGIDVFCDKNYREKQGILGGYLLNFIMYKLGLQFGYENNEQNKNQFPSSLNYIFIQQNVLSFLKSFGDYQSISFVMKVHQCRATVFDEKYLIAQECILRDLINSGDLSKQQACVVSGTKKYVRKIDMRVLGQFDVEQFLHNLMQVQQISNCVCYLFPYIILYVVRNFVPKHPLYNLLKKLNAYFSIFSWDDKDMVNLALVGHTNISLKIEQNLIKYYFCEQKLVSKGYYLLKCILEQNNFWGGDRNVFMGKVYIGLAVLCLESSSVEQSIRFYRSALAIIKRVYPLEQVLADRYCFLCELLIMIGRYNEAVKELQESLLIYYEIYKNSLCMITKKLVCIKYIRAQSRRSQSLLKISKQLFQEQQITQNFNSFFPQKNQSNQISEIVDGVLSVLEQVLECFNGQLKREKMNGPVHSVYKKRKQNLINFGRIGLLKVEQISQQIVEILVIIYRVFELCSKRSYLDWFIKQYLMNKNLLKVLCQQYQNFKVIMRIFIKYNLKSQVDLDRGKDDKIVLRLLFETLMDYQNGDRQLVSQKQAHQFLYYNYINKEQRSPQKLQYKNSNKVPSSEIKLFQKIQWFLANVNKQMTEIITNKLFDKHRPLNKHPRSQGQQILVLMECLGIIVGFEFLIAGIEDDAYGFDTFN